MVGPYTLVRPHQILHPYSCTFSCLYYPTLVTMAMVPQGRSRPDLSIKTDYPASDGYPKTAFRIHRSPLPTATPITAKHLPSPLQPSTPRYDSSVRQHEMAMVESLGGRSRQGSYGSDRSLSRPLSPVAEQAMATRVINMTMDSPVRNTTPALPVTAPGTPQQRSVSAQRQQTIAEETRSMLLSGMSPSEANDLGVVPSRRLSAPADVTQKQRRQSLMLLQTDMLQTWGHVYFGDPTRADVFVAPSALRRLSGTDGVEGHSNHPDRLVIRARVRPRSKERKPFIITRSFNLGELRATLPSPTTPGPPPRRQSGAPLSPDTISSPRMATSPLTSSRRGSSVAASSPLSARRGSYQQKSQSKEMPIRKLTTSFPAKGLCWPYANRVARSSLC